MISKIESTTNPAAQYVASNPDEIEEQGFPDGAGAGATLLVISTGDVYIHDGSTFVHFGG